MRENFNKKDNNMGTFWNKKPTRQERREEMRRRENATILKKLIIRQENKERYKRPIKMKKCEMSVRRRSKSFEGDNWNKKKVEI